MNDQENTGAPPLLDGDDATPIKVRDVIPESASDSAAIDTFLCGFGRGFQVQIVRTAPLWCAGFIATLPLDHGITLSEIRESYGGRRFQLRIIKETGGYVAQRTVLISDVPRDNGHAITELDRSPETKAPPAPSGLGELAGVLRDLLAAQQTQAARQAALFERLILTPPAAPAAQLGALDQIRELGGVIQAVRDLTPAVAEGSEDGGMGSMAKLAESLISKMGERRQAPPRQLPPRPPRVFHAPPRPAPPRPPRVFHAPPRPAPPRPAPVANPAPIVSPDAPIVSPDAPIVPNATTIAAMEEARAMDDATAIAEPNPAPDSSSTVDFSSNDGGELADGEEDDGYTSEDVGDMLEEMPIDDAAEVIRGFFERLPVEDQQRAAAIFLGEAEKEPTQ